MLKCLAILNLEHDGHVGTSQSLQFILQFLNICWSADEGITQHISVLDRKWQVMHVLVRQRR